MKRNDVKLTIVAGIGDRADGADEVIGSSQLSSVTG